LSTSVVGCNHHGRREAPAQALIEEAGAINEATREPLLMSTSLVLAAWRGQEGRLLELIDASIQDAAAGGEGGAIARGEHAKALLYNGLGRYQAALAAARQAGSSARALTELVEAGTRTDHVDLASAALEQLEERTRTEATDWTLGVQARSRALLSEGGKTDALYQGAIDRLARCRAPLHLARARLLYGEWLRREGRRVDARDQLRTAEGVFARVGALGFAERTRRELLATGETVRTRTAETRDDLTAQEAQIAQLAGDGYTNPEIGAHLFLSPRTVEWHLRKVFMKLGISSRRQLRAPV
jgi:DNA-binding CsgD family transcriptional regulator